MGIKNITLGTAGEGNLNPRICFIETDDTVSEITATGYLNDAVQDGFFFTEHDMCVVSTKASSSAATKVGWYEVTKSGSDVSLTSTSGGGSAVLPTQTNHLTYFTNTTGEISSDDGVSVTHNGTLLTYGDNATSFRLKGPSSPNDPSAGADVQTYSGMFYNDSYDTFGVLKTRATFGANTEMDLVMQAPRALLLIAQDGSQTDGVVKCASQTQVQFHARYSAEQVVNYGFFDRVDTGSTGNSNTSAVTLDTNDLHLHFQDSSTTHAIVLPTLASGSVEDLEAGVLFYDTGTNKLMFYNGSALETVTSST